jgi:DNA invertase Pin-like site-specific DNA recombinase
LRLRRKRFQAAIAAARARGCYVTSTAKLTQAQAIEAARLLSKGKSVVSTARFFGVRPMTLRAALRRHGLMPPSCELIEQQVVAAARRIAKGETLATVARALGVWPVTLGSVLRRYGLSTTITYRSQRRN